MFPFEGTTKKDGSSVYPTFQNYFGIADAASAFWQPTLKAFGRTQLDLANLRSRQMRAFMSWGAEVMRPQSPMDVFAANVRLWQTLTEQCAEVAPSMLLGIGGPAETAATVHAVPDRKSRDTLVLLDRVNEGEQRTTAAHERRVA